MELMSQNEPPKQSYSSTTILMFAYVIILAIALTVSVFFVISKVRSRRREIYERETMQEQNGNSIEIRDLEEYSRDVVHIEVRNLMN